VKGGNEAEIVENRRTEFMRVLRSCVSTCLSIVLTFSKSLLSSGGDCVGGWREPNELREELAGFVVDGVSDALDLLPSVSFIRRNAETAS